MSAKKILQLNNLVVDTMEAIKIKLEKKETKENPSFKEDLEQAYNALQIVYNQINQIINYSFFKVFNDFFGLV